MNDRYLEQWERVQRWYQRIEDFSVRPSSVIQINALDTVYAFFVNCFHLKDWIRHSRPEFEVEVEALFDDQKGLPCFNICASLANGSKHLVPDNRRPTHGKASIVTQSTQIFVPALTLDNNENSQKYAQASYQWTIDSNQNQYNAYSLAKECMEEWQNFFKNNDLI